MATLVSTYRFVHCIVKENNNVDFKNLTSRISVLFDNESIAVDISVPIICSSLTVTGASPSRLLTFHYI